MFDQERCLLFAKTFDLTALEVQIFCKGIYHTAHSHLPSYVLG